MINKDTIPFEKVDSSQMIGIYYHAELQNLYVKFKNKDIWCYENVTNTEYHDFINSDSLGKYFHANIKTTHFATKL